MKQQFTEEKSDLKRFIRIVDYTQKTNDIRYVYSNGSENYVDCTDVVVVRYGASAGYVGRGINGIIANNLFTIRPINSALLNKSYLHYSDIKNEVIEICDYEIQCKIANLIESITEKLKVEEELLNLLYIQKSYLLQNMFI